MINVIKKYFRNLTESQYAQYERIMDLYPEWNDKINVISRKDIENLEINHILHSLSIAKFINFQSSTKVLDFGTGGGLPGIPLAIYFPNVKFHLIDRVGKKLKVASSIAEEIGLTNVTLQHGDIGECHSKFDFVVSRAVMPLPDLIKLCRKNISKDNINSLPNGVITLKGGELESEIAQFAKQSIVEDISTYFDESFFETKKLTYTHLL